MGNSRPKKKRYGYVSIMKLYQIAAIDSTLDNTAKKILILIGGYCDQNGKAFPSISKMAKQLSVSRAAIYKQIKILEEHDYLAKEEAFCKVSNRQMNNVYILNMKLAETYGDDIDVFSKENIALMTYYLATSGSCTPLPPREVIEGVASTSCTKKKKEETHRKNTIRKNEVTGIRSAKHKLYLWQEAKQYEAKTGITSEHQDQYDAVASKLSAYMGYQKFVKFDIELGKTVSKLEPLDALTRKTLLSSQKLNDLILAEAKQKLSKTIEQLDTKLA